MSKRVVIIAAGGTGSRLNANLPKQYMLLQNKPVLMRTIDVFAPIVDEIIVVISEEMDSYWRELCNEHNFHTYHHIVYGGTTRFQSVKNGLNYLLDQEKYRNFNDVTIAIHDAARPLVDPQLIIKSYELATTGTANVLASGSTNSIRIGTFEESLSADRTKIWQVQTPQTFPAHMLIEAYQQEESKLFTDDASVVEKIGYRIHLLESNNRNIKLTFREDFEIANIYLNDSRQSN